MTTEKAIETIVSSALGKPLSQATAEDLQHLRRTLGVEGDYEKASLAAQEGPLAGVRTPALGAGQENPPIDSVPFGRVKTDAPIWDALVVRRLLLALEAKQDEKLRRLVERIEASGVKLVTE